MKKILLILTVLFSLSSYSQGVKISAMPIWSTSLDSVWFPIIYNDGSAWINYRAQGYTITGGGGGLTRFGVSGEDDQATQVRDFDQDGNSVTIHGGVFVHGTGDYITQSADYGITEFGASYLNIYRQVGAEYSVITAATGGDTKVRLEAGNATGSSVVEVAENTLSLSPNGGNLFFYNLIDSVQSYVLYTNPTNGKVTYGAAPSGGGGGGSGIQSIEGNNGVTVLTDSIVQLGSATAGASTFTAIRYIDATSSYYLDITGNSTYTLRVHTTANRAIYGEASGAGVGVTGQVASGFPGVGVQGTADNGSSVGVQGNSTAGIGTSGSTATGWAGSFGAEPSSTNTSVGVLRVLRSTSGTAANNIGGYISFWLEYSSPSTVDEAAGIGATYTDISARTSDLNFYNKLSNSRTETMTLKGGGNLILNTTAKGYGLKSPDGTVWYITVSNAGVLSTSTTPP